MTDTNDPEVRGAPAYLDTSTLADNWRALIGLCENHGWEEYLNGRVRHASWPDGQDFGTWDEALEAIVRAGTDDLAGAGTRPLKYRYVVVEETGGCRGTDDLELATRALEWHSVFDCVAGAFLITISDQVAYDDEIKEYRP